MSAHAATFAIAPTHPSLPGHFPGEPVVPGVVVLDEVLAIAEAWRGGVLDVAGLPQVKFASSLLPGEVAHVSLDGDDATLRFVVRCGERAVAQGAFTLRAGATTVA